MLRPREKTGPGQLDAFRGLNRRLILEKCCSRSS